MHQGDILVGIAALLVLVVGPLLFGLRGRISTGRTTVGAVQEPAPTWDWRLAITSALLYAVAFNLIFFVQELFLVLPKALTAGLRPILFHNNHTWAGGNPLARLFQGTGALAIFATGVICALLLKHRPSRSPSLRLFLIWMAYNGFLQSLPQVVIGSIEPENDVGMAMDYLHLGAAAKIIGRPMKTKRAPSARALAMSLPRRTPPSSMIGRWAWSATISGRTRSGAMAPSNCRPPWLDRMMP